MHPVSPWIALLVAVPLLWQAMSDGGYLGWAHTLEAIWVPLLLWLLNLQVAALGFAAMCALCNLSLWGYRTVPGIAGGVALLALAATTDPALVIPAAWFIAFAVLVNAQAQHHLDRKSQLKRRQADLLKFLPKIGRAHV